MIERAAACALSLLWRVVRRSFPSIEEMLDTLEEMRDVDGDGRSEGRLR